FNAVGPGSVRSTIGTGHVIQTARVTPRLASRAKALCAPLVLESQVVITVLLLRREVPEWHLSAFGGVLVNVNRAVGVDLEDFLRVVVLPVAFEIGVEAAQVLAVEQRLEITRWLRGLCDGW